jgi:branched-chain amino acid transport system ATP-binding protein
MNVSARSISAKTRMAEVLRVENLSAGYGDARVVHGVSFSLEEGQSLALLGRNGVGKTTLIDSLIGVTTRFGGQIAKTSRLFRRISGRGAALVGPHRNATSSAPSPSRRI